MAAVAFAALVAALGVVATQRLHHREAIECLCTSTHFGDVSFTVRCQRNSTGRPNNEANKFFIQDSSVVCERGRQPTPRTDYKLIGGFGYYKFHPRQTNWDDALRTCAREGANLVIAKSEADAKTLQKILREYPKLHEEDWLNDQVWVGANDLKNEGTFLTLQGKTLREEGYEKWARGEPNNEGDNEHCLAFDRQGLYNDEPCETSLAFICRRVVT